MDEGASRNFLLMATVVLIGSAVGYFVADDSATVDRLRSEVNRLEHELVRRPSPVARRSRTLSLLTTNIAPRVTNTLNSQRSEPAVTTQKQAPLDQEFFANWVRRAAEERNEEYNWVFSELGLPSDVAERFKSNLVELHEKAIVAGKPLEELTRARATYDREIRTALGEENYNRYVEFERSKPAIREYNKLAEYSWNENRTALDPAYFEKLIGLIKETRATTTETWHNAYDPLPRPAAGREMFDRVEHRLADLSDSSSTLLKRAAQIGLPEEYIQLLSDYYTKEVNRVERTLALRNLSPEQIARITEKEAQQQREDELKMRLKTRNSPGPNQQFRQE